MLSARSEIHKILVVSLSNIGDVVLTLPVVDILRNDFPEAQLSLVVGPKAQTLFQGNPHIHQLHIFDKKQPFWITLSWVLQLRAQSFDLVVDLRNTAIPFLISPRYRTPCLVNQNTPTHMRQKHLQHLRTAYPYTLESNKRYAVTVSSGDTTSVQKTLTQAFGDCPQYIVVAPGAADQAKRWPIDCFIEVCYWLVKHDDWKVVCVGDKNDRGAAERLKQVLMGNVVNLCGQTSLLELAAVLQGAFLAIVNDSAPMHLASYLDVPVLALFGPSDPQRYGPWGANGHYLRNNQDCAACRSLKDSYRHTCMEAITGQDVLNSFHVLRKKVILAKP